MTLEIVFTSNRRQEMKDGTPVGCPSDSQIISRTSSDTPKPDKIICEERKGEIRLCFVGVSKSDASTSSIDAWSAAITDNLSDVSELTRRDI